MNTTLPTPLQNYRPQARQDGLIIEVLVDETLVYDKQRDRMHCLNRSAALIWQRCDGEATVAEIAAGLGEGLATAIDADVVWLALRRLESAHLLTGALPGSEGRAAGVSRRELSRRLALTAGMTLLLPVVQSIVAPTPAMAASCSVTQTNCMNGIGIGCCCSGGSGKGCVSTGVGSGSCTGPTC